MALEMTSVAGATQCSSCFRSSSSPITAKESVQGRSICQSGRLRSEVWGSGRRLTAGNVRVGKGETAQRRDLTLMAKGFNFWEVLGGRGLVGGENSVNTEEGLKKLFSEPEGSGKKIEKSSEGRVEVTGIDGFEKELSGLVGGFPGGEKGLEGFLQKYPPPQKGGGLSEELEKLRAAIPGPATKAKTVIPPLLMPGMTVIVKSPSNSYHNFTGIVQRVTDGRVGVLFEGGVWDKLISFKLTELERTDQGPPMSHPKSAILLQQVEKAKSPNA